MNKDSNGHWWVGYRCVRCGKVAWAEAAMWPCRAATLDSEPHKTELDAEQRPAVRRPRRPIYRYEVLIQMAPDSTENPEIIRDEIASNLEDVWPYAIVAVKRTRNASSKALTVRPYSRTRGR